MRGSHGTFYWNELMTRDVEGAKKFYADTLGWSYDAMPMADGGGTYWLAMMDGEPVGGILDISAPEFGPVPESWMESVRPRFGLRLRRTTGGPLFTASTRSGSPSWSRSPTARPRPTSSGDDHAGSSTMPAGVGAPW